MTSKELHDQLKEKGYQVGYEYGVLTVYLSNKDWKSREKVRKLVEKGLGYVGSWGMKLKKEATK
ncbi:MAG: hypothetical protein Q4D45_12905 [Lachnospiraceae bacterium]|nr:hypothetical protein [Lachnospiraceae bacterium]